MSGVIKFYIDKDAIMNHLSDEDKKIYKDCLFVKAECEEQSITITVILTDDKLVRNENIERQKFIEVGKVQTYKVLNNND